MKIIYEQGDIFKYDNDYYIIACIGGNTYTLISIVDGSNFDSNITGDINYINSCIEVEDLVYIASAREIININN